MIYFVQLPSGAIKIGFSNNPKARFQQLKGHYRSPVALLTILDGDMAKERELHARFRHLRFGKTEQFKPAPELFDFIGKPLLAHPNPEAVEKNPCHIPGPGCKVRYNHTLDEATVDRLELIRQALGLDSASQTIRVIVRDYPLPKSRKKAGTD